MNLGMVLVVILGVAAIALIIGRSILASAAQKKEREERRRAHAAYIYGKYGHSKVAEDILNQVIWTGESGEQLRDSLGRPIDIDQKVLKTKKKEVWKYAQTGTNRFGLRITLDNDVVVGWDEKL